jgi:hypothetical protein
VFSFCRSTVLCWLLAATFCAVVAFQLFVSLPVGVTNNGDFGRLIGRFSLGPPADAREAPLHLLLFHLFTDTAICFVIGFLCVGPSGLHSTREIP